ncbi:NRPS [Arachnomyces sp. PD_36]|nr:NRPS [Arachnomyces sp. PD_36]
MPMMGVLESENGVNYNNLREKMASKSVVGTQPSFPHEADARISDLDVSHDFWISAMKGLCAVDFPNIKSRNFTAAPRSVLKFPQWFAQSDQNTSTVDVTAAIHLAWSITIAHYTDANDVVFGHFVEGGNPTSGASDILGSSCTTAPFRFVLRSEETVKDALARIQQQCDEQPQSKAFDRREVPPGFLENASHCALIMSFTLSDDYAGLQIWFDENTIPELQDGNIGNLNVTSPEDIERLREWNGVPPVRVECLVHNIIYERTVSQPESQAICAWDGTMTYRELDDWASSLAARLISLGVGPETFVPIFFEKSKWTPVSMLAVMKAGGAFVLLDTSYPLPRLQAICAMLEPSLILSSVQNSQIAAELGSKVVTVSESNELWQRSGNDLGAQVSAQPSNALYASFTSGSTGQPKGVVIDHATFCSSEEGFGAPTLLRSNPRVLQFASYAFSVSILDQLSALMNGGCICIPSESDKKNGIVQAIRNLNANWTVLTASAATLFKPTDVPSVKTVIFGGELPTKAAIEAWANDVYAAVGYGSTEVAVCRVVGPKLRENSSPLVLGQTRNSSGWIVDQSNPDKLMPIGAVGELLIEGPMGRGYLGNPSKTAEVFIESPAWMGTFRDSSPRVYRTGDLMEYEEDGSLRFVGRKDTQIKLRGQRVELGDVEHHIRQHVKNINTVVAEVIIPKGEDAQPMLAAFIQYKSQSRKGLDNSSPETSFFDHPTEDFQAEMRGTKAKLMTSIPNYMVPSVFIPVLFLPLTPTAKINRVSIRQHAGQYSRQELEVFSKAECLKRPPRTQAEKQLQKLFSSILNISSVEVGADDDFFSLGGNSIRAMKLVGMARDTGLIFTVADILNHPKLSDLALAATEVAIGDIDQNIAPFLITGADDLPKLRETAAKLCGISEDDIEDIYPCTPMQQGLMAITSMRGGEPIPPFVFDLPEDIDIDRFKTAWELVVEKNPIIRTRIVQLDMRSFQVVVRGQIGSESADFLNWGDPRTFGGLGEPLAHFDLPQIDGKSSGRQFVLTVHHALYDGWSLQLMLNQLEAAYEGEQLRQRPFNRFIEHISDSSDSVVAKFWQSRFSGHNAAAFPATPSDSYVPHAKQYANRLVKFQSRGDIKVNLATAVQLAWSMALYRYTDSDDVIFGNIVNGRSAPIDGIVAAVGSAIALVPVRVQLRRDQSVADVLQVIQQDSIQAIPFEHTGIQNISRLGDDLANQGYSLFGLDLQMPDFMDAMHGHPLMIECRLDSDSILINVNYDEHMIPELRMQAILQQFDHILQQIVESPELLCAEVDPLSPEDRDLLEEWNAEAPESVESCVHDLIIKNCETQPDAQAVSACDGELTYQELHRLSSALAMHLVSLGVGPEVFVPLCFEKSRWVPVAMVAVMKSGGAFVNLDPSHPVKRLQDICRDVGASLILTSISHEKLGADLVPNTVVLGDDKNDCWENNTYVTGISTPASPSNALYVVFTSGTTSKPKGVLTTHSAFCTSSAHSTKVCKLTSESRVIQFSSYSFDASIFDHLATMIAGGCICIPSELDGKANLTQEINKLQANWAMLTPSLARVLSPKDLPTLKTLVLGGEKMMPKDIETWFPYLQLMVNAYGPSECAVISTMRASLGPKSDAANIGFSTGGVCWIVDRENHNQLAPVGGVGELLIEGNNLARCYLNEPEKTASSFIEAPAWLKQFRSGFPTSRLYKTGDLVQYAADGSMRYLGRKDTQVKLRGQRIELTEVEHHVRQCFRDARDAVAEVVVLDHMGGLPMLAAFVWNEHDESHNASLLLDPSDRFKADILTAEPQMLDSLPPYMLPQVFIPVPSLPLTKTGKMDRRRLCQAVASLSPTELAKYRIQGGAKSQPSTETEVTIQRIVAQVLNLDIREVGMDDSLMRLGGDSITAMQVSSRFRDSGFWLNSAEIFRGETLSKLAAVVQTRVNFSPQIEDEPENTPFGLSPIQSMFFEKGFANKNHFNMSFCLRFTERTDPARVHAAVDKLVSIHSMLRARFERAEDGAWTQTIMPKAESSCHFYDHNAASGPIFHVDLIDIHGKEQLLSLISHHLVIDLVSWRVILVDLQQLLTTDIVPETPSLSFQKWCHLQSEHSLNNSGSEGNISFETPKPSDDYWGITDNQNTYGDVLETGFSLSVKATSILLGAANGAFRTKPVGLLHAALLHSFAITFSDRCAPGRDDVIDAVRRVKDSRRHFSDNGYSCFTSRYLNRQGKDKKGQRLCDVPEIVYNHDDQFQQPQQADTLLKNTNKQILSVEDSSPRFALIDVASIVMHGCAPTSHRYTLSDFTLLPGLSYGNLEALGQLARAEMGTADLQIENAYPCSPAQQFIMASHQRNPISYCPRRRFDVVSNNYQPLCVHKLQKAWTAVLNRHTSLRTIIVRSPTREGWFDQVVLDTGSVISAEIEVLEGDSQLNRKPPPQPVGYIAYLRRELASAAQCWNEYIKKTSPCFFPADSSTHGQETGNFQGVTLTIDRISDYQVFCQKRNITLATFFKSIWALVLDLWIGANSEINNTLLDLFICYIHFDVKDKLSIKNVMDNVQEDYYQSLPHHGGGANALHGSAINPTHLFFNSFFNFLKSPGNFEKSITGASSSISCRYTSGEGGTPFDLYFGVTEFAEHFLVRLDYLDSKFSSAMANQILVAFDTITSRILAGPDLTIGSLRQSLLEEIKPLQFTNGRAQ